MKRATASSIAPPPSSARATARGSPRTRSASSPPAASPPFGRLVLAALRSIGIEYVALEHLRMAKKNALEAKESMILWRLMHDLVLIVLLDFDVDVDAISETSTKPPTAEQLALWQELARHYLYEWGFVCRAFYSEHCDVPSSVLLLAVAWLLAYANFFERQHEAILRIYLQTTAKTMPCLPPYGNDAAIPELAIATAVATVESSSQQLYERISGELDRTVRLNQLQALVGRIHIHLRMLQTSLSQYDRMIERLKKRQRENGEVHDDELLPAYALQVFANGKTQVDLHVGMLTERLQMIDDEKLLYKWINGLVLQHTPATDTTTSAEADATTVLESQYAPLSADILHAKSALEDTTHLYQQIASLYVTEMKKWSQKAKTRTQQTKMDEKMEKLRHEITANELLNVDALFLDRSHPGTVKIKKKREILGQGMGEADLERLQHQLERVMHEITSEYCNIDLI